uniref:Uncharacterized protein n=1 Tax=Parascaris univalens TaxID=6257 RepID=A0A914ZI89_PARUN
NSPVLTSSKNKKTLRRHVGCAEEKFVVRVPLKHSSKMSNLAGEPAELF